MSRLIIPYGIRFKEDGRLETFPAVELVLTGRKNHALRALFHVDSGATTSVLPASDAELLDIRMPSGKKMIVRGIGGEPLIGYRAPVNVRLQSITFRAPMIFIAGLIPRILGREGVFPLLTIIFNEAQHRLGIWEEQRERARIDALFE